MGRSWRRGRHTRSFKPKDDSGKGSSGRGRNAEVNFHGSTSWGQDYAACIQGGHGDKPFTDIMRATDALIETGTPSSNPTTASTGGMQDDQTCSRDGKGWIVSAGTG